MNATIFGMYTPHITLTQNPISAMKNEKFVFVFSAQLANISSLHSSSFNHRFQMVEQTNIWIAIELKESMFSLFKMSMCRAKQRKKEVSNPPSLQKCLAVRFLTLLLGEVSDSPLPEEQFGCSNPGCAADQT